jgi:hypothetical protein
LRVLVVNAGSSSLKLRLLGFDDQLLAEHNVTMPGSGPRHRSSTRRSPVSSARRACARSFVDVYSSLPRANPILTGPMLTVRPLKRQQHNRRWGWAAIRTPVPDVPDQSAPSGQS